MVLLSGSSDISLHGNIFHADLITRIITFYVSVYHLRTLILLLMVPFYILTSNVQKPWIFILAIFSNRPNTLLLSLIWYTQN